MSRQTDLHYSRGSFSEPEIATWRDLISPVPKGVAIAWPWSFAGVGHHFAAGQALATLQEAGRDHPGYRSAHRIGADELGSG